VHGGVRYLRQGNVSLVLEALKERGYLRQNAPHLVHSLPFIVPNYDWWEGPFYGIGLKLYDMLAGRQNFARSKHLSRAETQQHVPTLEPDGLRGGVIYYDGQFDDARLALNMAQTAAEHGATVCNYVEVTGLLKTDDEVKGVQAVDRESGDEYELHAKAVINATGVFADTIRQMDEADVTPMIQPSQGVHIVLDRSFLPGDTAIMVPETDDGRVLFAIPWHDKVIVGTTDTPVDDAPLEPRPQDEELDFLVTHAARYLTGDPTPDDVLSTFAGLRPLVSMGGAGNTAAISRDHTLHIAESGLITITGGKWTTYRKMAEDTIDQAATLAQLDETPSVTKTLRLHGYHEDADRFGDLSLYGSDASHVQDLINESETHGERLHPDRPVRAGEVVWAARHEMARTVEDFLSRRTRTLLLDARASIEMAPRVASLMADELGKDDDWQEEQVQAYQSLAKGYLLS
jgi:glycerol-3-phosphate dehydrogenase